jgi:hypothetical protein
MLEHNLHDFVPLDLGMEKRPGQSKLIIAISSPFESNNLSNAISKARYAGRTCSYGADWCGLFFGLACRQVLIVSVPSTPR